MTLKTWQTCWSGKEGAAKEGRKRRVVTTARKGITRKPARRSLMISSIGSVQPLSLPPFPPYSRRTASDLNDIRLAWLVLDDT